MVYFILRADVDSPSFECHLQDQASCLQRACVHVFTDMPSTKHGAPSGHLRGGRALQEEGPRALVAFVGVNGGRGSQFLDRDIPFDGGCTLRTLLRRRAGGVACGTLQLSPLGAGVIGPVAPN